ncbi:hypothetical protein JTB14_006630 [Gonioctena quinquepunctata]|nr:hypothetical protein JTB14_006630 [Gonioctena quinquepunctata]
MRLILIASCLQMTVKTCSISILLCLSTLTVASFNETAPDLEKEAETELTYTVPYYNLTPLGTGALVFSLGVITITVLYLPTLLYRICYLFGGCQTKENRFRREHFIATQLGAAKDIKGVSGRSLSAGPILASLARAHEKYS